MVNTSNTEVHTDLTDFSCYWNRAQK